LFEGQLEKQLAYSLLHNTVPDDHARQMTAETLAAETLSGTALRVLDVGCGAGVSIDLFRDIAAKKSSRIEWHGVDIGDSPEVRQRTRADGEFRTFDGVNLPYKDAFFDVVYSDQVFEHVRHPDALMRDIARVLKPDGMFLGSVAYLEPFHSYSIFNFTPYGMVRVCEDAGLSVTVLRPGVDSWTLLLRHILRRPPFFRFFQERLSPLNALIELGGRAAGLGPRYRNYIKLQYCGQFCFVARPERAP
jgi:SAM-dependent methyltransferase